MSSKRIARLVASSQRRSGVEDDDGERGSGLHQDGCPDSLSDDEVWEIAVLSDWSSHQVQAM